MLLSYNLKIRKKKQLNNTIDQHLQNCQAEYRKRIGNWAAMVFREDEQPSTKEKRKSDKNDVYRKER